MGCNAEYQQDRKWAQKGCKVYPMGYILAVKRRLKCDDLRATRNADKRKERISRSRIRLPGARCVTSMKDAPRARKGPKWPPGGGEKGPKWTRRPPMGVAPCQGQFPAMRTAATPHQSSDCGKNPHFFAPHPHSSGKTGDFAPNAAYYTHAISRLQYTE